MGRPAIDLTGMEVGRLTVLGRDVSKPSGAGKSAYWLCQCECGNITSVRMDKLKKVKSALVVVYPKKFAQIYF